MSGFTLKNDGASYDKIMQGRRWVGRVYRHTETGRFHGVLGELKSEASTKVAAFEQVAALALGYDSPEAVRAHNSAVRQANAAARAPARALAREFLSALQSPAPGSTARALDILDRAFGKGR